MSKTEFPDWAKPGEKVLVVTSRYSDKSAVEGVIERLTATRIVVKMPNYTTQFAKARITGEWEEYGTRGNMWQSSPRMIHAQSEAAQGVYLEMMNRAKLSTARNACATFQQTRDVTSAREAVLALQEYIESEGLVS